MDTRLDEQATVFNTADMLLRMASVSIGASGVGPGRFNDVTFAALLTATTNAGRRLFHKGETNDNMIDKMNRAAAAMGGTLKELDSVMREAINTRLKMEADAKQNLFKA